MKEDIVGICKEYCIGCGLCSGVLKCDFDKDEKGYIKPKLVAGVESSDFLDRCCPVVHQHGEDTNTAIWGKSLGTYMAFSTNAEIRKRSSSGGVLTELAIFLLESKKVDGVIQVRASQSNPAQTVCQISRTKEDVLQCSGSRYAISSPWLDIEKKFRAGEIYCAIGKPCDIYALRRIAEINEKYQGIRYFLSFFCAGLPSENANHKLLKELGCEKDCTYLNYRGNGWPGYTVAQTKDGKEGRMEYGNAWGDILGRDIHPYCRICLDGIGEAADISCGDGWFIKEGKPDFSERDGRNIVFVRTRQGKNILDEAVEAGAIERNEWDNAGELAIIQKYQLTRRVTMKAKLCAYRIMRRNIPQYNKRVLKAYSGHASLKLKARIFAGSLKRLMRKTC